ncbi:ISL3 family transposase [bacterium]|nr:ISL3 family transposase [bacterium]
MDLLSYLLPDPEVTLFDNIFVDSVSKMVICTASVTQPLALCPLCRQPSMRIHSRYRRTLGDLLWAGLSVQIGLHVRRFQCDNTDCQRKIFCERVPTVAAPWARRTLRLANAQQAIGLTTGGAGGSRLCAALAMNAGIDLLLDLIRTLQIPERTTPRVLGVDDWAKRKGHSYGTILVDLEQGEVVDVLLDRTPESLQQWLMTHPGVEIISQDRAGAYAEGARLGAPNAVQVADRWHLLKNLTNAVYKALQQHHTEIEGALIQGSLQEPPRIQETDTHLSVPPDVQQPTEADRARQQRAEEAHRLHALGWTTMAIATHLGHRTSL